MFSSECEQIKVMLQRYKKIRFQNYKKTNFQGYKDTKNLLFYLAVCWTFMFFCGMCCTSKSTIPVVNSTLEVLMQRIRTITETLQMLKKEDPETCLSEFLIRKLANNYKIRSIKTGNKVLIDYDSLLAFLQSKSYELPMEQIVIG